MTYEYLRALSLVVAFVLFAILVAKALERPIQPMTLSPRVVKTIMIDADNEIERQEGWQ
ncbi:MAG: hypothetical protein JSR78_09150 [Proteobacteria bacterium]|nr:hypothetical protein [Pseudomonadota bacterium]